MLAIFTVNNPGDFIDSNPNVTTLREAIAAAEATIQSDIIDFSTNPAHGLNGATITLTEGELTITQSVSIDASMLSNGITVDASGNDPTPTSTYTDGNNTNDRDGSRVFSIFSYGSTLDVTFKNLTITGGDVNGSGGGIDYQNRVDYQNLGGGSLNLFDVKLIGNHASDPGGGLSINVTGSQAAPVEVRIERSEKD
jgi:hypothetical protein